MDKKIYGQKKHGMNSKLIVDKIKRHNFIQQMIEGTLNEKIFKEYIARYIVL